MTRKKLSAHHIVPRSRIPDGEDIDFDNIVYLDERFHNHWHAIFGNMKNSEIILFIDEVMKVGYFFTNKDLEKIRNRLKKEVDDDESE